MTERKLPPGIREHHGKYQLRYRNPATGKEVTEHFRLITDARKRQHEVAADKERRQWVNPRLGQIRFGELARHRLDASVDLRDSTRATCESYLRSHLLPYFANHLIGRIRAADIQAWIVELQDKGLAPKTIRECYRLLSATMQFAVDDGMLTQSPCGRAVKLPRVPRQEQRFLSAAQIDEVADTIGGHHAPLVYSAAYLGCRWGELAGLKRTNLDLLRRRVQIVGTLEEIGSRVRYHPETKSNASRRALMLPRFLADMLAAHLAQAPVSEYVFTNLKGEFLRRGSFRTSHWLPATRRADLEGVRFHDLRHTAVALSIAQGAHPKEIQARLGHSSITTTLNTYGHLFPSLDEQLTERLDEAFRRTQTETNADQTRTKAEQEPVSLEDRKSQKAL
ncbi:MAG: site-specific integrase [Actinobacteria bacterium]|nr:site-specific integrase [Actinomycetota bacterium]